MKTRVTMVMISVVSLAVGYAMGQSQRTGFAASPAAGVAAAPHADHVAVDEQAGHAVLDEHAGHALEAQAGGAQVVSSNKNIPPATEGAKARLNASPRHSELVKITAGGAPLNMWVVYPERSDKAPVVV